MSHSRGYSLLEMTLVLLVLSLVANVFITYRIAVGNEEKQTLTASRAQAIQDSLTNYRRVHKRLPCPAQGSLQPASANYGVESANPGTCVGGVPSVGADYADTNEAIGVVPTRTLNLADDFMLDGYGHKFTYAVDTRATSNCAFTNYPVTDTSVGLTVSDTVGGGGAPLTTGAWYVLVGHGPNGHGAFMPSGTRYSAGSTNADERANCHCLSNGSPDTLTRVFVQRGIVESTDLTNRFDDYVLYASRADIRSVQDEAGTTETCP